MLLNTYIPTAQLFRFDLREISNIQKLRFPVERNDRLWDATFSVLSHERECFKSLLPLFLLVR